MKSRRRCTIYMGTFKTQKMAQRRATSCSAVFQVFKLRPKPKRAKSAADGAFGRRPAPKRERRSRPRFGAAAAKPRTKGEANRASRPGAKNPAGPRGVF